MLPARYQRQPFWEALPQYLRPGLRVLDAGSGRNPCLKREQRKDLYYAGLDISEAELKAARDAYDEAIVADLADFQPHLAGQFDLVLCYQVLEHVRPIDRALENLASYLKPGGILLTQFSGKFAVFALVNAAVPTGMARWVLSKLQPSRPAEAIFPATYDRCWKGALDKILQPLGETNITPIHITGAYLVRYPPLLRLMLLWENGVAVKHDNLASHYFVVLRKPSEVLAAAA